MPSPAVAVTPAIGFGTGLACGTLVCADSTAAAVMHLSYKAVIALAMLDL